MKLGAQRDAEVVGLHRLLWFVLIVKLRHFGHLEYGLGFGV